MEAKERLGGISRAIATCECDVKLVGGFQADLKERAVELRSGIKVRLLSQRSVPKNVTRIASEIDVRDREALVLIIPDGDDRRRRRRSPTK